MSQPVDPAAWSCPTPVTQRAEVVLGHGGGGRLTAELVQGVFLPALGNEVLDRLADAGVVTLRGLGDPGARLALTTDAFVVEPVEFPGGDIGSLAVHGTVNDLACAGAAPLALTAAFIIEEGTSTELLARVAASMGRAARQVGLAVVAGDTKVVERRSTAGHGGVMVTTAGVGVVPVGVDVGPERAQPGDAVVVSGPLGEHGIAVMSVREGLRFGTPVVSDSAPVHREVAALFAADIDLHALRDPTRGGLAAVLNEIATASRVGVVLDESSVPVTSAVRSACAMLGLDPLQVASEGRLVVVAPEHQARQVVEVLDGVGGAARAAVVGQVVEDHPGVVVGHTAIGGTRIIDLPLGELLPRIC